MSKWKDIFKEHPPWDEDILFMTGDDEEHIGYLRERGEKLRKSQFFSYVRLDFYECNKLEPLQDRVIFWHPLPELPE